MNKILISYYDSPCGRLCLGAIGDALCLCDWVVGAGRNPIINRLKQKLDAEIIEMPSSVTSSASRQLDEYFIGKRQDFDIPLLVCGTEFQCRVWDILKQIPYGERISYHELAQRAGNQKASRAVANACNANALSIFIPCHRIVGSNGCMTGYAGGLRAKSYLLTLEESRKG